MRKKNKYITIYSLADPITNQIRYVGKTIFPMETRLKGHMWVSKKEKTYRCSWIKSLLNKGLQPIIEELEQCSDLESNEKEIYWIAQMKAWGFDLVNGTTGGDSGFKYIEDALRKIRSQKGLKCRKIYQYTLDGNYNGVFNNIYEASILNKTTIQQITQACHEKNRKRAGYRWSYEYVPNLGEIKPKERKGKNKPRKLSIEHIFKIKMALLARGKRIRELQMQTIEIN